MRDYDTTDRLSGTTLGPFTLEQPLAQGALGALYVARADTSGASYLVRTLAVPVAPTAPGQPPYADLLRRQAEHVAQLRHPYILPLLDYGIASETPYLAWPQVPMRPLATRLVQNVPLDPLTVGRYLDQIADALEYAHQQATLHRNLSPECVFIQRDGRLIVADFGVRRMLELGRQDTQRYYLYDPGEACAPEQTLRARVDTYTDVYALGALLYQLLAGRPLFAGGTREEIAQAHLQAPIPPLASVRTGLPPDLDAVLARALAKDPSQRYRHPGELANAYHDVVSPGGAGRVAFAVAPPTTGDGVWQAGQGAPDYGAGQAGANGWSEAGGAGDIGAAGGWASRASAPTREPPFPITPATGARLPVPARKQRIPGGRTVLLAFLILAVVAGGALTVAHFTAAGAAASGEVFFTDNPQSPPGHSDALAITVNRLDAAPSGSHYAAWLINQSHEHVIALGDLSAHGQQWTLSYVGLGNNSVAGPNLLAAGTLFEVTLEQANSNAPVGKVVLSGRFPPLTFVHLGHLLISFPSTPGPIGLLVGVLLQSRLLDTEAHELLRVAANQDFVSEQCYAQSVIDILEGTHGTEYAPLGSQCTGHGIVVTGDGYGLLGISGQDTSGYLGNALDHASLAVAQPDATREVKEYAKGVAASIGNVEPLVKTILQDAIGLLRAPTNLPKAQEVMKLADQAYLGVDMNDDGHVDAVPGEGGAVTAYQQGQLMATLDLAPPQ
jgi:eukaryotic-like serine/threonine-protein kinase